MLTIKQICEAFNERFGGDLETFYREDGVYMHILNCPKSDSYCFGDESDFDDLLDEIFDDREMCEHYLNWYLDQSGSWEIDYCTVDNHLIAVCCNAYLKGFIQRKLCK
jgi:hypothetical protein